MSEDGSSTVETIDAVVAYYPYNKNISLAASSTDGSFTLSGITLPSIQHYDYNNVISKNTFPMVSVNEANAQTIKFKNLCGVLELSITGTKTINSISITGNQGEQICGDASVKSWLRDNPSISMTNQTEGEANQVVLDCGQSGVQLNETTPTIFRIVLPPVTFAKGFMIKIRTGNEFMIQKTNRQIEIKRSNITAMSSFSYDPEPENLDGITGIAIDLGNDVTFDMIKVQAGTFTMGATPEQDNAADDEKPAHEVTLSDYYIGQMEVTQELWEVFMNFNPSFTKGNPQYPVDNVTWNEISGVDGFLSKLNAAEEKTGVPAGMTFTLPTEAQWEYAARGGNKSNGYKYSGSDIIDEVTWYCGNCTNDLHPVGVKLPNELGICDMSGNVREWCSDRYGAYTSNAQTDPVGPGSGSDRVIRGGFFNSDPEWCRVSSRFYRDPVKSPISGFRLVLVVESTN